MIRARPRVYQPTADVSSSELPTPNSELITASYTVTAEHQIAFNVPKYDETRTLVIDPVLVYSTYVGGSGPDRGSGGFCPPFVDATILPARVFTRSGYVSYLIDIVDLGI